MLLLLLLLLLLLMWVNYYFELDWVFLSSVKAAGIPLTCFSCNRLEWQTIRQIDELYFISLTICPVACAILKHFP